MGSAVLPHKFGRSAVKALGTTTASLVALWLALLLLPSVALGLTAPHVAAGDDTDTCAMCHRNHSAASGDTFTNRSGGETNSLLLGAHADTVGDTELCYACHGWGSLGSEADVDGSNIQEDFEKSSAHVLAPATSDFGPTRKDCSDCHDSHGWARTDSGTPYPALLNSLEGTTPVNAGDAYCDTCHKSRPNDLWPGLGVWSQTAHADVTATASGTQIVCSVCHAPHGSSNNALVAEVVTPPSAPATTTVTADDRSLCYACHTGVDDTYLGTAVYEGSGHGSNATTVAVSAEWASRLPVGSDEASRTVGQCQVCHAPMGRDDGTGNPVPKLQKAEGPVACYQCHGTGSTIGTDIRSEYATAGAPVPEVVASYAATRAPEFGVTQVYTRESTDAVTLMSPRQAIETNVGPTAVGDIDADGKDEIIVSRGGSADATVLQQSDLSGLVSDSGTFMSEPSFVAVGDVLDSASSSAPKNEVVTADGSTIRVYRWNDPGFTYLAAVPTSATVTGLAVGDVLSDPAVPLDEVVVTTAGVSGADNRLYVLKRTSSGFDLEPADAEADGYPLTGEGPRGPAVGDFVSGGPSEIAVAFDDAVSEPLKVYSGDGTLLTESGDASGSRPARSAHIADVLSGSSGDEVITSVSDVTGDSRVDVFTQSGGVLTSTPLSYALPSFSNAGSLASADLDGDGRLELLVSLAGSYAQKVPAGFVVLHQDAAGTGLDAGVTQYYTAGGVEHAGSGAAASWVAVADIGDLGRSRHAVDAAAGSHVSTETAGFARHVVCADCHNVHASTSGVTGAPAAFGPILGVPGVALPVLERTPVIGNEYELCFKCHAGADAGESRDIASEVATSNASYHAVLDASSTSDVPAETFVASTNLDNGSVIYCTACHGNSDPAGTPGLHASDQAPLLKARYNGASAYDDGTLCFTCHRYDVYYTGSAEATITLGSRFWNTTGSVSLHAVHGYNGGTSENALSCQACHVSHGSSKAHLIRKDIGYTHNSSGGGSCDNGCHTTPASYDGR